LLFDHDVDKISERVEVYCWKKDNIYGLSGKEKKVFQSKVFLKNCNMNLIGQEKKRKMMIIELKMKTFKATITYSENQFFNLFSDGNEFSTRRKLYDQCQTSLFINRIKIHLSNCFRLIKLFIA
jgi:hypothetical protein